MATHVEPTGGCAAVRETFLDRLVGYQRDGRAGSPVPRRLVVQRQISRFADRVIYDLACLGDHRLQVLIADKTFGVDFVDILGA